MQPGSYWKRFAAFLVLAIFTNVVLFELFGDDSVVIRKEAQFISFMAKSNSAFLSNVAEYIHTRAPWLEEIPYATPETDMRLSTWYLPPHQVVAEWMFFIVIFIGTIAFGRPSASSDRVSRLSSSRRTGLFVTLQTSIWTLLAVVYYKVRAWVQVGEWFAPLYLFQPCHMLLSAYVVVCVLLLRDRDKRDVPSSVATTMFHTLFDLQWFTWVAMALPDTQALIERDFFGEYFLFYFEHALLVVLPYLMLTFGFSECMHRSWKSRMYRAWYSLAWFGIHHIQVMTPISLVSGIQINYQTHLPRYALLWFGRAYKHVITGLSLVSINVFAFVVDPIAKRAVRALEGPRAKSD